MATVSFEKDFCVTKSNVERYATAFSKERKKIYFNEVSSSEVKAKDINTFFKKVKY